MTCCLQLCSHFVLAPPALGRSWSSLVALVRTRRCISNAVLFNTPSTGQQDFGLVFNIEDIADLAGKDIDNLVVLERDGTPEFGLCSQLGLHRPFPSNIFEAIVKCGSESGHLLFRRNAKRSTLPSHL